MRSVDVGLVAHWCCKCCTGYLTWLQRRGYAFWSLGHCYSPEMDYKRQLGHRIYPRRAFRALLAQHRGPFDVPATPVAVAAAPPAPGFAPLRDGDTCDAAALLAAKP